MAQRISRAKRTVAIRLARQLTLSTEEPEARGLLALMLLNHARSRPPGHERRRARPPDPSGRPRAGGLDPIEPGLSCATVERNAWSTWASWATSWRPTAFFVALGLTLQDEGPFEGGRVDRVVGSGVSLEIGGG